MRKYFVWTADIERVIRETRSGKRKRLTSSSETIVGLFSRAAEASEHYYQFRKGMYEVSRTWKNINLSKTFSKLERAEKVWDNVDQIFTAIELQRVLAAPDRSIIITKFEFGGYSFEVIKPSDSNYDDAFARLPGAA